MNWVRIGTVGLGQNGQIGLGWDRMDGLDWGRTDRMDAMGMGMRIHPREGYGIWMEVREERGVVGGVGDKNGDADQERDAENG